MTAESLTFISAGILERLENGSFVPARRSQAASAAGSERRNVLSPLAVTKRCIRYEPNVFYHRKKQILHLAYSLNLPEKKVLLIGGPQGCGKTSLIRGVIELMGSRNEQLLWFDVNRHTDFEEIIHFLIHYITYVCTMAGDGGPERLKLDRRQDRSRLSGEDAASFRTDRRQGGGNDIAEPEDPIQKLEKLIRQVADMPLLLVLDNVEYIVDAELRFNSYPFKEMLNFLLEFPNIKMVLIGERLPYADMSPNQDGVDDLQLAGLSESATLAFMHSRRQARTDVVNDPGILEQAAAPDGEIEALRQLYRKTQGYPWLLKVLFQLNHQSRLDFYTLNRLLESETDVEGMDPATEPSQSLPISDFIRLIYERLPDQHRKLFQVLSFLRHPVNIQALQALAAVCYPVLGPSHLSTEALEDILEHSLLRPVLKISYPPQEVLAHVRAKRQQKQELQAAEANLAGSSVVSHSLKASPEFFDGEPLQSFAQSEGLSRGGKHQDALEGKGIRADMSSNTFASAINPGVKAVDEGAVNRFRTASESSQTTEGTVDEVKSSGRFKPGYELYHVVKRILYRSLSANERERIHGILQDFYLRERTQDSENRILRVKNRALLAEAKFHGSGARGRKPGKGEKNSDAAAAAATNLPQTPYRYQVSPPLNSRQRLTLDDYKRLSLPDMGNEAETSLEGPTFTERLEAAANARPMAKPLSDLELTEEERMLLHRVEPPPTVMRPVVVPKALPTGDTLEQQLRAEAMQASQWVKPPEVGEPSASKNSETTLGPDLQRLAADVLQEGNEDEQEKDIQQRLAAAVARQDRPRLAQELLELARYRSGRGRYQSAAQCLEKAHSLRGYAKKEVMAEIYRLSGSVNKETYHHNTALASLTKAAAQIKRLMYEDETVNAVWLGRLGQVYQDLGEIHAYRKQFEQAVEAFSQSLRWYHSADDPTHEAEIHFQLAGAYDDLKQSDSAIVHYEKALALDEASGNFLSAAASLTNLGNLHLDGGRLEEARECFRQALQHDRTHHNIEGQLQDLECLMNLYGREENFAQAENIARQALSIAVREGFRLWQASLYLKLAQFYAAQADWPQALQNFERSRTSGEAELSTDSLSWLDTQIADVKARLSKG